MLLHTLHTLLVLFCISTSSLVYPMSALLKVITRITTLERDGKQIHFFHDYHDYTVRSEHEQAIVEVLQQNKQEIFVEDKETHFGDQKVRNYFDPITTLKNGLKARPEECHGNLFGFIGRLQQAGIVASTIECRIGIDLLAQGEVSDPIKAKTIVDDYKKICAELKIDNPQTRKDQIINATIAVLQKSETYFLTDLQKNHKSGIQAVLNKKLYDDIYFGGKTVDMIALKRLGNQQKASVFAGYWHCQSLEAILINQLGWKRIKSVGKASSEHPLSPKQIKNYFKRKDSLFHSHACWPYL